MIKFQIMKRILTLMAAIAIVFGASSCKKDKIDNNDSKPGIENEDSKPGNDETINSTMRYGYLENYGLWYEDQPEDVNNWILYLSESEFDEDGWSYEGDLIMIELFSKGIDAPKTGRYTIEAFYNSYYSDFSVGDGYVEEEENEEGETEEYCYGTWLFQDGYGIAAALSGEVDIQKNGNTYTVTYDFCDDDFDIVFKGTFTGELDIYDYSEEVALSSTKSNKLMKEKKKVSCRRIGK